jgi:hypothetical protein
MNFFSNFVLYSRPYLNPLNQCYQNIVTINLIPNGPLRRFVRRIKFYPLSVFKINDYNDSRDQCGLAVLSLYNNHFMSVNEIPDLFSYLQSNGYKIDTSLSKMMNTNDLRFQTNNANKIICFVTYLGK